MAIDDPDAQIPLPADLRIVPPAPDVPPDVARFSGVWGNGAWGGILPMALIVERIAADGEAVVVYALADCEQFGMAAGWTRETARIRDRCLSWTYPDGTRLDFAPSADGRLTGDFRPAAGYRTSVSLDHVQGRDFARIAATLALPRRPPWEEMRIPVRSAVGPTAGQVLQLQAFHYGSSLPGRQPLIVFSHGSGDGEIPGAISLYPSEPEARFFRARGFSVLALMRKGRGRSEGSRFEDSDDHGAEDEQLDGGLEDLHAAIEHMRMLPHVDPARIVLAGQSRGGFLSVAYAGRHPGRIAGVVNFVGGWWSEDGDTSGFNRRQAALAGAGAIAPMLWLYGDRDSYYSLPFIRDVFKAFQDAGGRGTLIEVDDLPGDGHALLGWIDRWELAVIRFLDEIG